MIRSFLIFFCVGIFTILTVVFTFSTEEKKPTQKSTTETTSNIQVVLYCQSTEFPSDKVVITYYTNNTADYIPYSSSGLFDSAYSIKQKVIVSDYKYTFYSPYHKTVEVDRSSMVLSTMVVMSYHNSRGDTFESWRHYPCTISDSALSKVALDDVKLFETNRANQRNQDLSNRKI